MPERSNRDGPSSTSRTIAPLAQAYATVWKSPDPQRVFGYTPGLARLPSGRLIATCDTAAAADVAVAGPVMVCEWSRRKIQGLVFTSDDAGQTWQQRATFPFMHARPFIAGRSIYVLGCAKDLFIIRSDDNGDSWSAPARLTDGQLWHQSACAFVYAHDNIYLTMERRTTFDIRGWEVGELAPVLMRGPLDADLTQRENWAFASELSFRDALPGAATDPAIDYFGVPFFAAPYPSGSEPAPGRCCAPMGWLESNVVRITDPDHIWHDPTNATYHLWMRAHTGGVGYAAIAKVTEESPGRGAMTTRLETVPSNKRALFVPCPGGQMRFHVIQDEQTGLYWLLSTQSRDSATRADRLPANRYNLPNNERRRLQLHFSKNMIDWCFAGLVAVGETENASRHYASMIITDNDLLILSRSGDARARTAHDGNLITFHRVTHFRDLVY